MGTTANSIVEQLKQRRSKDRSDVAKKRLVPIDVVLGVSTRDIRILAKEVGKDRDLAEALWSKPYMEAKALAILLLPLKAIDESLIMSWVSDIDDWSTCDLFAKSVMAKRVDAVDWGVKWAASSELYTKRAGLALIANFCMRATAFDDDTSSAIRSTIEHTATDERDHVRQASCWALREFGKSNAESHEQACILALEFIDSEDSPKVWVGRCAYRELEDLIKVPERRRLISRKSKTGLKYSD